MSLDRKALAAPGRIGPQPWRLEVINTKRPRDDGAAQEPPESFQYNVLVDSGLKLQAALDRADAAVGDSITLTAELREGQRLIAGLTDVRVTVSAPTDGRGNWLSTNDVSPRQLALIPAQKGPETLAPVVRKGLYLTDIASLPLPARKGPQVVRLYDDGTNGDVTADDGIYTNRFDNTRKEGTYSFYFQAQGPTQNGNKFLREREIQAYLPVRPTPETILVNAAQLAGDTQRFDVVVTPRDPYDNYLGPGQPGLISIVAVGGSTSGNLRDNLDGSYTQTIVVPSGTDPQDVSVTVTVGEVEKTGSLDEFIPPLPSKLALSLHAGQVDPSGDLKNIADSGPTVTLDLLYRIDAHWGLDFRLGYASFDGRAGNSDTDLYTLGTNLKYTFNPASPVRIFLNGGGGLYDFDPGDLEVGVNVGVGLNIPLSQRFSFEATYNYHNAVTASDDLRYDQLQLGVLVSF